MKSKEEALKEIEKLVESYKKNEAEYSKETYLEYSVRSNFIDKFFEAFNWDIYNNKKLPPSENEVIREEHVSDKSTKRVDYAFQVNGDVKFLIEAKKPSENLSNHNHIFQAKSYAFSMGVNLIVLTNFKEFKLYDIKVKPLHNQPEIDCVSEFSITYNNYKDSFDRLWALFEYQNVTNGSMEQFYYSNRKGMSQKDLDIALKSYNKKGISLLNKVFLDDLLIWREKIAKSIFDLNKGIDIYLLNEIVQRYIDRIVFLRIVEDREIEGSEILLKACTDWYGGKQYSLKEKLEDIFDNLNKKYNGMLFKRHSGIDCVEFEDITIYNFIMSLYVPNSPYNFAIIDIDILGKIFEQYLGHTLLVRNDEIILEIKDEEKKNTGVYYTRQEIVDEVIRDSVLPEINGIDTIEGLMKYRLIDISCGSGSFIIEAYRIIVKRYEEIITHMINKGEDVSRDYYFVDGDCIHLTMSFKKEIAINNIYGVDIDPQAIEITKMSIYILLLELNYKDDSIRPILPSLEENFKVGNSIVSNDYYNDNDFDINEDKLINPFDYESEFEEIFENGGFDCIVGNPPYVKIQTLNKEYPSGVLKYINDNYEQSARGNFDMCIVFVERAMRLIKPNGRIGMILLSNFFTSDYGEGIRESLSSHEFVTKIIDFGDIQVFDNSQVYTCLLHLQKKQNIRFLYSKVYDYALWIKEPDTNMINLESSILTNKPWYFSDEIYEYFEKKVFTKCQKLKRISDIYGGVQPTTNEIYLLTLIREDNKYAYCKKRGTDQEIKLEKASLKNIVKGSKDIKMYSHSSTRRLIFPYDIIDEKAVIISEKDYCKRYPETYKYLMDNKDEIQSKHKDKSNKKPWYRYEYVKNHNKFEQPKILIPGMVHGSRFSYDDTASMYITCGGPSAGGGRALSLLKESDSYTYESLLAILNSSLISYLIVRNGIPKSSGWQGIGKAFIEEIPIPIINKDSEKEKILNEIDKKAKELIKLYDYNIMSENELKRKERRIQNFLKEIDRSICCLYDIDPNKFEIIARDLVHKGYR